ncbi:MAG TPA: bifunctional acetate--CoA ligase family protein/GNAT family N-acetyltransferase, partial [Candidatus Saccharimonadales bacterium]|nr:bifunctional acetate--CoA ligase family protein/GNAT family N-acetyltransferase [Candidatus Saccharimonadales bacterium]
IYMESIGDARSFLSAAREVALKKPIIIIKPGRSEAARKAAASHTGAITGSDEVFEAAFRRCGILRVQSIAELFDMAEVLAKQPRPRGPRLAVVTNAGGAGVLATDALLANGGQLAQLSQATSEALNQFLPVAWSHGNPVDTLGDATPETYVKAIEIVSRDENCDALLTILAPQGMSEPEKSAALLCKAAENIKKPLLASWMGGSRMQLAADVLNEAHIPTFEYPDAAARIFAYMWRYTENQQALYETPEFTAAYSENGPRRVNAILAGALAKGRTILTEQESKQVLAAYDIPVTETVLASTPEEAVATAGKIGYPVVLKLHSEVVTHKSDRGGVKLKLENEAAVYAAFAGIQAAFPEAGAFGGVTVQPMVRDAGYELLLGSSTDPQFGPVLVFGLGGQLVEVLRDTAHTLPPLTTTLARLVMQNTRIYRALQGVRGRKPVDLGKLEELLVRFSELVIENPRIADIEINPLFVSADSMVALDARVILHPAAMQDADLVRPAIRPYPSQYVSRWHEFTIRPIRPEDEPLVVDFHHRLSDRSVYLRYFVPLKLDYRISHKHLITQCFIDYARELALVAEYVAEYEGNPESGSDVAGTSGTNAGGMATGHGHGNKHLAGVARMVRNHNDSSAEIAFLVADKHQHRGLGSLLLERMIEIARLEGISSLQATVLAENTDMQELFVRAGFQFTMPQDGTVTAELQL